MSHEMKYLRRIFAGGCIGSVSRKRHPLTPTACLQCERKKKVLDSWISPMHAHRFCALASAGQLVSISAAVSISCGAGALSAARVRQRWCTATPTTDNRLPSKTSPSCEILLAACARHCAIALH